MRYRLTIKHTGDPHTVKDITNMFDTAPETSGDETLVYFLDDAEQAKRSQKGIMIAKGDLIKATVDTPRWCVNCKWHDPPLCRASHPPWFKVKEEDWCGQFEFGVEEVLVTPEELAIEP